MPLPHSPSRTAQIRAKIQDFIKTKLGDQAASEHRIAAWLKLTAERAKRLQQATHIVKGIHSAANGTNIRALPGQLTECEELGTHSLGESLELDVATPGAEESGVYPFLQIDIGGMSLLEALRNEDADVLRALHDDEAEVRQLREDLLSLLHPRPTEPASHVYAKQFYWCVDEDAAQGFIYHLLAPLYPSSLVHLVYKRIKKSIGKESREAWAALKAKKYYDGVVCEYPNLAIQKVVASNPQNVSNIMKKQGGRSYLLSSAPPHWKSSKLRIPYHCNTIFDRIYGGQPEVRETVSALLNFLAENPPKNRESRNRRAGYVDSLIGELIQMAANYQQELPAGWSRDLQVELSEEECLWLDPYRVRIPEETAFRQNWMQMDWLEEVGVRFGCWLNAQLEDHPVGDLEYREWKYELTSMVKDGFWLEELYKELAWGSCSCREEATV